MPVLLHAIVDLRSSPFRPGGVSCRLPVSYPDGARSAAHAAEALREVSCLLPESDIFISLDGVAGIAAAGILPLLLGEADAAGVALRRLVVDLEDPFPEILAEGEILETIDSARARGVRMSLSRAGLSESGLATILGTRPDYLKIAPSVVSGCGVDFYRQAIIESIAELAWKFGAAVLAEGVLTLSDARWLSDTGIALGLGPLFGVPLSLSDLRDELGRPGFTFGTPRAATTFREPASTAGPGGLAVSAGLTRQEEP